MLTKIPMDFGSMPIIKKTLDGAEVTHRGAFAAGSVLQFTVEVPRKLGASALVMRICADGESDHDLPLTFCDTVEGVDYYTLSLDTEALCGARGEGLFFYEFLFLRGFDTLFTNTFNQVSYTLESRSEGRFLLLIHKKDFGTPRWFHGKTMYHIFVDRFCRGEGAVGMRTDAVMEEDWENGIPQYPKKNGDAFSNNVFFGGNLWGVAEKLEYLKSLGVGVIYLSPIFRAFSNHKYDTGDYLEIDSMFGGEDAFRHLLEKAKILDIGIILDGVFNHTGDDSRYFDRYGKYGGIGAHSNPDSPYRDWFRFRQYPDEYETWWGIRILPKLNLEHDTCKAFLVGEGGVAERYIRDGIAGWRLDVADELPDAFLDQLRKTVKSASDGQAILIGEVWENAAEKISYGKRRRYFRGDQLDSVMNYPFRNGVLAFLLDGDGEFLGDVLQSIYATYPKCVCDSLMNLLGTHDTERILSVLGEGREGCEEENDVLATRTLSHEAREKAIRLLKLATVLQYTVYGVPSVFYGDEVGMEGYHDPFCRRPYPWHNQEQSLLALYRKLGEIRSRETVFAEGDFRLLFAEGKRIAYTRTDGESGVLIAVNADAEVFLYPLDESYEDMLNGRVYDGKIEPYGAVILKKSLK